VKVKGKPTGRSRVVKKALPVLSGSDSDKPSAPIAKERDLRSECSSTRGRASIVFGLRIVGHW
jgi:hypothetical protein